jgi:hypothetical protein
MRCATGADHGPFILARQGLYVRESGVQVIHLVFKGNDLHSGSSPTMPLLSPLQQAEIEQLCSLVGPQNRVAYVSYPSNIASIRSASMSVSPPLGYWNLGTAAPHKAANRHFTDPEVSFLGTSSDRAQRLGVELTLAIHNATILSGLYWEDPGEFLQKLSYVDEHGNSKRLSGFDKFHPTRDTKEIKLWLGYWKWYMQTSALYLIFITKQQLRNHRPSPASTVISPALFGHHQNLDMPTPEPNQRLGVVEDIVGLFGASGDKVCPSFGNALQHTNSPAEGLGSPPSRWTIVSNPRW